MSKSKGTHVKEIIKFKNIFKMKWNCREIKRVVCDAIEVFKQKKETHEGRCWRAYEKAKFVNLFIQYESFMRLFNLLISRGFHLILKKN